MKLKSGHTVVKVSEEEQAQQSRDFKPYNIGVVRLFPDGWFFLKTFLKYADRIYNFEVRPTDVFIATFPKCGTTWTQEIIWTIKHNKNLDNPSASLSINSRAPFVDFDFLIENPSFRNPSNDLGANSEISRLERSQSDLDLSDLDIGNGTFIQMSEGLKDPRILKVHLPFSLLPQNLLDTCKVIYVARNPKDVCISFHHHSRLIKAHDFVGTLDQFVDHFINDTLVYSPYWTHVKEAWNMRHHPNMRFMFYEDMKANPMKEIEGLDKFLETNLTEKEIENVVEYTSFKAMKTRDNLVEAADIANDFLNTEVFQKDGGFFRAGQAGDFKNKLTKEQENKIDLWTEANTVGTDLKFKYN